MHIPILDSKHCVGMRDREARDPGERSSDPALKCIEVKTKIRAARGVVVCSKRKLILRVRNTASINSVGYLFRNEMA